MYWPSVQDDWKTSTATTVAALTTAISHSLVSRPRSSAMKGLLTDSAALGTSLRHSLTSTLYPVAALCKTTTACLHSAQPRPTTVTHSATIITSSNNSSSRSPSVHPEHQHHFCSR